jgi:serine phosphatase RsbU (regulator of sigma subunit)
MDDAGKITKISASGTPIGLLPISRYEAAQYPLVPGTRLLVYTDGMTEVFRGEDEFGEARLLEFFAECKESTPETMLDSLFRTLQAFSFGYDQSDDMTALVLFRNQQAEK